MQTATNRFLQALGIEPGHPICVDPGKSIFVFLYQFTPILNDSLNCTPRLASKGFDTTMDPMMLKVMSTMLRYEDVLAALEQYKAEGISVGSTTALLCEASDAAVTGAPIEDGQSGDIDFPHGNIKAIATCGERSVCESTYGLKITGTPDGLGAYLPDDKTVRVIVQSEGYGPLKVEAYDFPVNNGTATFGGSHLQYVDYDRTKFASFMSLDMPASDMVVGMGEMIENVVNLKGELVGKRNGESETPVGVHYSNTGM